VVWVRNVLIAESLPFSTTNVQTVAQHITFRNKRGLDLINPEDFVMKKRTLAFTIVLIIAISVFSATASAADANPTASTIVYA
jgi:hypothetical protein